MSDVAFDELVIDEANFDQYFFDITKHGPKPGQVLACFESMADFVDGNLKRDVLHLIMNNARGGILASNVLQKIGKTSHEEAIKVVKEMTHDLLSGMSTDAVLEKPYPFRCQFFYYTEKKYIPENDRRWWSMSLIDCRMLPNSAEI